MSHESFDDPAIAQRLNENFIAIKVDREEHPLVDDTYMMATQALTGAGGWPMTIFAMPDGRAFHAGTYYPAVPRGRTPSFTQVLEAVGDAWENRRDALEQQAEMLAEHLAELGNRQNALLNLPSTQPSHEALAAASDRWIAETKPEGGLTPAPKFPATWALKTLWRSVILDPQRSDEAFEAAATNLEAILRGGLQDHVGGGFARYCVDEHWSVPHFEKMLYDNAGLLSLCARTVVFAQSYAATAHGEKRRRALSIASSARRAAHNTAIFLESQLLTGTKNDRHRAFASSLDADSVRDGHSVEGAYYTFTKEEVNQVLGGLDALPANLVRLAEVADDPGHFQLSLNRSPQQDEAALWEEFTTQLRALRAGRALPGRDEKIIAGWNGLAIEALCEAGLLLEAPQLVDLAEQVADTLWAVHFDEQTRRLARVSFDGTAATGNEATLQDYAALTLGCLALASARGRATNEGASWAERAQQLLHRAAQFVDPATGIPRDSIQADARLDSQRKSTIAASVLDDAVPAAGALYAKALAQQAIAAMAAGTYTEMDADNLELARQLSAHALALSEQAPTQVATALEVQSVISGPVHYVSVSHPDLVQAREVRRISLALGLGYRGDETLTAPDGGLQIQPCRKELCRIPVSTMPAFLESLRTA